MSEDNHVDILAVLHGDLSSFKRVEREIDKAIQDGVKSGSASIPQEIQKGFDSSIPQVRRAANTAMNAWQDVNRAKRESLRIDAEGVKIAQQRGRLESELLEKQNLGKALRQQELQHHERLTVLRRAEAQEAEKVIEREGRLAQIRRDYDTGRDSIRRGNAAMKGKRLQGDYDGARTIDRGLQPLRTNQVRLATELRVAQEQLAASKGNLKTKTEEVSRAEKALDGIHKEHSKTVSELSKIEAEHGRVRSSGAAHTEKARQASQNYERQMRREIETLRNLDERQRASNDSRGGRGGGGNHLYRNASAFGDLFRSVPGSVGGPLGAVLGPLALADMVSYGEALTTAGQALALIPAVATAAGAAVGTLALGMHGFDDAIKNVNNPQKFIEALQHLSPAAQQAAMEIQSLVQGPLGQLKRMVQEDLFKGIAPMLHGLAKDFAPTITQLTTGVASAFNGMFKNFGGALQGNKGGISEIVGNIVSAFQKLEPAVKPFVDALVTITRVGSGFLPSLADSITNVANTFNNFIQKAANDGSLQGFIQRGIDAAKMLGGELLTLGKQLFDLFGNKDPQKLKRDMDEIRDSIVTVASWVQKIAHFIHDWKTEIEIFAGVLVAGKITGALGNILKLVGVEGGILGMMKRLGPSAADAGAGMAAGLAPAIAKAGTLSALFAGILKMLPKIGFSGQSDQQNLSPDQMKEYAKTLPADSPIRKAIEAGRYPGAIGDQDTPASGYMNQLKQAHPDWNLAQRPDWWKAPADIPGMGLGTGQKPLGDYQDKQVPDYKQYMPQLGVQLPPGMQALPGVTVAPGAPAPLPGTAGAMYPGSPGAQPKLQYGTDGTPFARPELGYHKVNPEELNSSAAELQKAVVDLGKARAEYDQVMKSGIATEQEKLDAQVKTADAQRSFNEKELQYHKDALGKWEKVDANLAVFGEIGAHLDKDLGFSKGLPGLADNLVKFVASMATAPIMGKLAQTAQYGDGSYGLLGEMFGGYGNKKGLGPDSFQTEGVTGLNTASSNASTSLANFTSALNNATGALGGQAPGGSSSTNGGGWWPNLGKTGQSSGVPLAGPNTYAGIGAGDTADSASPQHGGIPGAPTGQGQDVLSYMQSVMNGFNQKTGSHLSVSADYPGGPTGHPDDGGDHSARRALDVSGSPQDMNAFAAYVANDPGLRAATRQLIHNPGGSGGPFSADMNIIGGQLTNGFQTYGGGGQGMGGHLNHDHWALQYIPAMDQATTSLNSLSKAATGASTAVQGGGSSNPKGPDADLARALKANGFTDSQITGLTALNGVETGNWSHPESIMGFTNQQTGPGIDAHVSGFKNMWDSRQKTGAVSAVGDPTSGMDAQGNVVDPAKYAQWLLKLEGYSATTDWAGNKYAPGQFMSDDAYANSVTKAYQPGGLPSGGGRGLPVPAGPKLDFGGSGGGNPFGFSPTPGSPSNGIADLLHSGTPNNADFTNGFAPIPGGPQFGTPSQTAPTDVHGMSMPPSVAAIAGPKAAQPFTPKAQEQKGPSWQPQGGGGGGLGVGGLAAGAISGAAAAFGGPGGAAAAQTAMQLINRSIAFGGQAAGIGAEGLIDTLSPVDPDTGKNPLKDSWLWRAAGALAGAAPALGSGGSGLMDRAALKRQQDDAQNGQNGQNGQGGGDTNHNYNAPMVNIENLVQSDGQSGKGLGQDLGNHAVMQMQQYNSAQPPIGANS